MNIMGIYTDTNEGKMFLKNLKGLVRDKQGHNSSVGALTRKICHIIDDDTLPDEMVQGVIALFSRDYAKGLRLFASSLKYELPDWAVQGLNCLLSSDHDLLSRIRSTIPVIVQRQAGPV